MYVELAIPSNHLTLCCPLLLLLSIFPSIRAFSNESVLHIRWPKYWRSSFSISPSNEYSGLITFRIWRRKWQPTPVLLPGKFHGWRTLVGYSAWGPKESDTTERLHFHFLPVLESRNPGYSVNPLIPVALVTAVQYSCSNYL